MTDYGAHAENMRLARACIWIAAGVIFVIWLIWRVNG